MLTAAAADAATASASAISRASQGSGSVVAAQPPNVHGEKKFGSRFNSGFLEFFQQKELAGTAPRRSPLSRICACMWGHGWMVVPGMGHHQT